MPYNPKRGAGTVICHAWRLELQKRSHKISLAIFRHLFGIIWHFFLGLSGIFFGIVRQQSWNVMFFFSSNILHIKNIIFFSKTMFILSFVKRVHKKVSCGSLEGRWNIEIMWYNKNRQTTPPPPPVSNYCEGDHLNTTWIVIVICVPFVSPLSSAEYLTGSYSTNRKNLLFRL